MYRVLLIGQVGLTVALATSAALLVQSLSSVRSRDPGFVVEGVVVADIGVPGDGYDMPQTVVAFERRLLSRLESHGDVSGAATAYDHPLQANWSDAYTVSGGTAGVSEAEGQAQLRIVSPGYFASLGVEVLEGRAFHDRQTAAGGVGTALVNEAFARALGGRSIGRRLRSAAPRLTWGAGVPSEFEIIGIVENERFRGLEEPTQPAVYLSTRDFPQTSFVLLVRSGAGARAVTTDLRAMIREIEPGATVGTPTTLRAILSDQLATRRITADTIGGFAIVALALAALGLYGLVAMLVSRRTREIGVRLAVGASPAGVRRSVLLDGLRPALAGSLLGVGLALASGKLIEALLVGVSPRDPLTLGVVVCVLLAVAAIGCLVPAIRASRIDPARTLRAE